MALLSIAVWCDEHRGGIYPDQLIPQARTFARQTNHTAEVDVFLLELALRDPGLQSVIRKYYPKASDEDWEKVLDDCHSAAEKAIAECRRPILDLLPETPLEPANVSAAMRALFHARAVTTRVIAAAAKNIRTAVTTKIESVCSSLPRSRASRARS